MMQRENWFNFTELEYKLIGFVAFKYVHII